MSLSEKLTHRQFLVWLSWLDREDDVPNRSDYYLMALTREIRYRNTKVRPRPPTMENLKGEFGLVLSLQNEAPRKLTAADRERITKESRARWLGAVGGPKANVVGDPRKKNEG